MAPRKRLRPNPAEASSSSLPTTTPPTQSTATSQAASSVSESTTPGLEMPPPMLDRSIDNFTTLPDRQKQVHKSRSWYGSWPRAPKSSASTQLARETIFGGTVKTSSTPDFRRYDTKKPIDAMSFDGPNDSATTLPNIPEDGAKIHESSAGANPTEEQKAVKLAGEDISVVRQPESQGQDVPTTDGDQVATSPPRPTTASGWFGWLGRSPGPNNQSLPAAEEPVVNEDAAKEAHVEQPPPPAEAPEQPTAVQAVPPTAPSSWFDFWSSNSVAPDIKLTSETANIAESVVPPIKEPEDTVMEDAPPPNPEQTPQPATGSTWAFWSRDNGPKSSGRSTPQPESGELAVIGEGSEAHPKPTTRVPVKEELIKEPVKDTKTKSNLSVGPAGKKNKRLRPQSMEIDTASPTSSGASTPRPETSSKASALDVSLKPEVPAKPVTAAKSIAQDSPVKTGPPNLLLPSFGSTYRMKDNPSILKQISQLLLRTQQPPANHVFKVKEIPKIKKALVIGVHGLFPATYLRPMIGQPTGTSLRFASLCADGIRRWADAHGCGDCEIEKIALEGEGKIVDRVENLWKLLLNWIDQIRNADLIILACHSQGVPVAIMLLAKLIDLGIITDAKIGVCAMAGVSLGPFPDYKSSMGILMGTAAELWEFSNPQSDISQRYEHALKEVLEHGVRITFIGSIDDQLVPLESAIYSPAHHPYIYRAVFIDGRIHAPDFIAHLVGFALKLRNLGISDHGLIRELSVPLAGSLYSGEGHSRLYYDEQVYDLAVSHALETTSTITTPCLVQKHESLTNPNPYHLPWIMRGLLEEDFVKTELSAETDELLRQFDNWKPVTKALKDVKYRLEAVRSKL